MFDSVQLLKKLFEKFKNFLNVLHIAVCALSQDASHIIFVSTGFKISKFFAVIYSTEDNHKSPIFSVSGKFFAWELFFVVVPIMSFNPHTKCSPDECLQKMFLATFRPEQILNSSVLALS